MLAVSEMQLFPFYSVYSMFLVTLNRLFVKAYGGEVACLRVREAAQNLGQELAEHVCVRRHLVRDSRNLHSHGGYAERFVPADERIACVIGVTAEDKAQVTWDRLWHDCAPEL